tara:strand:- start:1928 stop:2470 length:543 start_codon:yes stop_codon:yes gene_type:complete
MKLKGGELEFVGHPSIDDAWVNDRTERVKAIFDGNGHEYTHDEIHESSVRVANIERQAQIYKNSLFTVLLYKGEGADDLVHIPDLKGKCAYLSIKRNDKGSNILWHEKMKMVQILLGNDWLGLELYPPYKFMVDTANQYHIICVPPIFVDGFPFGWKHREVNKLNQKGGFGILGQNYRGD